MMCGYSLLSCSKGISMSRCKRATNFLTAGVALSDRRRIGCPSSYTMYSPTRTPEPSGSTRTLSGTPAHNIVINRRSSMRLCKYDVMNTNVHSTSVQIKLLLFRAYLFVS